MQAATLSSTSSGPAMVITVDCVGESIAPTVFIRLGP